MVDFIWAGLLAAGTAWLGNCAVISLMRAKGMIYLTPAVEESAKTGFAVWLGAPVWLTHLMFGALEAVWDIPGNGRKGICAGMASLAGHAIFGLMAVFLWKNTGFLWLALLGSYFLHMAWNGIVLKLINPAG